MIGMKVEDRFDGISNFNSWNSRVLLILEEKYLFKFVNEKVPTPEEEAEKTQWRKNDARTRRILVDSVKTIWFLISLRRRLPRRCVDP